MTLVATGCNRQEVTIDLSGRFLPCSTPIHQFALELREQALRRRIVCTRSDLTHAHGQLVTFETVSIRRAGVLAAVVRMYDRSFNPSSRNRDRMINHKRLPRTIAKANHAVIEILDRRYSLPSAAIVKSVTQRIRLGYAVKSRRTRSGTASSLIPLRR